MNIVDYFMTLFEDAGKGNFGAIVLIVAYVATALYVLCGAWSGARRGFFRQLIRTITVAISAVISYLICTAVLFEKLTAFFAGKDMMQVFDSVGLGGFVAGLDPNLVALFEGMDAEAAYQIGLLPIAMIVVPLVFVALFIAISAVSIVLHWLISGALGFFKSRANAVSHFFGFLLGIVQGAAVALLVFGPISGMLTVTKDIADAVPEGERADNAYVAFYDTYAKYAAESPLIVQLNRYGGGQLYAKLTSVEIEGEEQVDFRASAKTLAEIYAETGVLAGADWTQLTERQAAAIRAISEKAGNDAYASRALSGLFRAVGGLGDIATDPESGFMPLDEPFRGLAIRFMGVLRATTAESIEDDLGVIVDVYLRLNECGALVAFGAEGGDPTAALLTVGADGKTAITYVTDRLGENPRTASLVTDLTQFAMTLLSETLPFDEDIVQTYNQVKDDLSQNVLGLQRDDYDTTEAYVADMESGLNAIFADVGLDVDPDVSHEMAVLIAEEPMFDDFDPATITDAQVNEILLSYYTAYQNANP